LPVKAGKRAHQIGVFLAEKWQAFMSKNQVRMVLILDVWKIRGLSLFHQIFHYVFAERQISYVA
jgi:hypothetical protein